MLTPKVSASVLDSVVHFRPVPKVSDSIVLCFADFLSSPDKRIVWILFPFIGLHIYPRDLSLHTVILYLPAILLSAEHTCQIQEHIFIAAVPEFDGDNIVSVLDLFLVGIGQSL